MNNIIFAELAAIMFMAALNSKALGASIVAAIAIFASSGDTTLAAFIFVLYLPAYILASFRD
jgi:hypothetical protein